MENGSERFGASDSNGMASLLREEAQRVLNAITDLQVGQGRNLEWAAQRVAVLESARFMTRKMQGAIPFHHPHATLQHALALAPTGGLALEFGVYKGNTLDIIARAREGATVFGFDAFQGLPEAWRAGFPAGAFAVAEKPSVDGAELVVGWFDDTLPGFLQSHPGPVDFLHVDCDLYSSTKTILDAVGPRLRAGSVIVFDEFFNYPGWQLGEYKAWTEHVRRTGITFKYEALTINNEQVVVRIESL